MQEERLDDYAAMARQVRDADPRFWIALGVGGLASIWVLVKVVRLVARAAGFITTAATLIGVAMYLRERFGASGEPDAGTDEY